MKKIILIISSLLVFSCTVLAEEHADAALEHANTAISQGRAGNLDLLTEHARKASHEMESAVMVATGSAKVHLESGYKHLHEAIKHADQGHSSKAIEHVKTAIEHIKAGDK